jgi:PAS domain S-box-containing protein
MLPDIDGYAILDNIRTDNLTATIPFIFMSVKSEMKDLRKGMSFGADDYLTKPFSHEELITSINTQLKKKNYHEDNLRRITKERLEQLMTTSSTVIFSSNYPDCSRFTYISNNINSLVGYTAREFMEITDLWTNCIHPSDLPKVMASIQKLQEESIYKEEYRFLNKKGQYIWLYDERKCVMEQSKKIKEIIGSLVDITERKISEEKLYYILKLENLITEISTNFISLIPSEVDIEINKSLKLIGECIDVEMALMFLIENDGTKIEAAYEWHKNNPEISNTSAIGTDIKNLPWIYEKLKNFEQIYIADVSKLPEEANVEKKLWKKIGIKSILTFPLYINNILTGFCSFETILEEKIWKDEDIKVLKLLGEIFSNVIDRRKKDEYLNYWIKAEELVTNIANRFIKFNIDKLTVHIKKSLKAIGEFVNADSSFIFLFSKDLNNIEYEFEWHSPDIDFKSFKGLSIESYVWAMKSLKCFEYINISSLEELPPDAKTEKKLFQSLQVISLLIYPVIIKNIPVGIIGFHTEKKKKIWKNEEKRLLRMVRDILVNVLKKKDLNEEIKKIGNTSYVYISAPTEHFQYHNIIGKSKKMQELYNIIEDVADVETTVLITGESGTGKELVAEALHHKGLRRHKPLVKFNCTALSETLIESELFGHVKGAFTGAIKDKAGYFEKSDGGVIFLDEIGDISTNMQLKLLRVIQEKEFERVGDTTTIKIDVRIIAATNQDLLKKVKNGTFRTDLYYRLNIIEIKVPTLRERKDDIIILIDHFINKFNKKFNKKIISTSTDINEIFQNYQWPGNVRELEHIMEYAFIRCHGEMITIDNLPEEFHLMKKSHQNKKKISYEESNIRDALEKSEGKIARAARILNISRPTLYKKMKEYKV